MSVIQRIRDKAAWIIFAAIALALIAFLVQDAAVGGRGGGLFSNTTVIGKVNGTKITRTDFEQKVALQQQMYGAQGIQREQLIGGVWQQEVDRIILESEYKKLGLQFTAKELNDVLFGDNPPSWLRQAFTDPNTGMYKAEEARNYFAQIKKMKNSPQVQMLYSTYIEPEIQQRLQMKYASLLAQSAYVPKFIIDKQISDNSLSSSISYVFVPYASISDSAVKVTESDIQQYAKKHAAEFEKKEASRSISFVSFSANPSSEDSAQVLKQLLAVKDEFKATSDVKAFLAKNNSDIPYYDSYLAKSRIQVAAKDSIFKLGVGGVFGPYIDGNNYVLAKVVGTKIWPDSAKVRHILIATTDGQSGQQIRDDATAKKLADSIATAIAKGSNFDSLVAKFSDDPGSKANGGVYDYFPQGQMVQEFNDFAFDGKVGDKKVVKTQFGYHYVEILGQKNPQTAYKIAYLAKPILASAETINAASNKASEFAAAAKDIKSFNEQVSKLGIFPGVGVDIKENDFTIQGIGEARALVRWIYENDVNDVSEPTEINDNYYVAVITSVVKPGVSVSPAEKTIVENLVRNEKKAQQILAKAKGNSIQEIAQSWNSSVMTADSLSFMGGFIPNVGNEPRMIGAAFNASLKGKVSPPIAGNMGVFVVSVNNIAAVANTSLDVNTMKANLLNSQRNNSYRVLDGLRKAATIKDYRFTFY